MDYEIKSPPQEFLDKFKHIDIDFVTDEFEELILQDVYRYDKETLEKIKRDVSDMFTRWLTKKLQSKENASINVKGTTRSNVGDTLILKSNFEQVRIDSIKKNDKVFSLNNVTGKFEIKKVIEVFNNGVKPCYKIELRGGKNISSSNNHKFYVVRKFKNIISRPMWLEVQDIKVGDYICIPDNIKYYKSCNLDLNTLKLLGFYLADGYLNSDKCVVFDLSKQHKINYLCKLESENKSLNFKIRQNSNGRNHINFPNWNKGYKFYFNKKVNYGVKCKDCFSQLIHDLKLNDYNCYGKFIPSKIKQGTRKELFALLSGLFSGDGFIDKTKGLGFTTTSEKLFEDVKTILTKLGLNYSEKLRQSNLKNKIYYSKLIIIGRIKDCEVLLKNCDFDEDKFQKLSDYIFSKNKSKLKCSDVFNYGDVKFRKITNITYIGNQKVYDFEVEDNHNYVANLIISSNSGKSLASLRISDLIVEFYNNNGFKRNFDTMKIVCGNQKEFRQNLKDSDFGDVYQIDENAFANVGIGSATEMQQLKDIQNIIAKKNIHTIYITPRMFLETNAVLGLSTFGRDSKNWLSRFLLYDLRMKHSPLLGYIIIDVGKLFRKYGCYVYKQIGGCTNPNKLTFEDIEKDSIKYSSCIPKDFVKEDLKNDKSDCPFYNICKHPLCHYEHKKDSWINREMEGGMDERTKERYTTCFKLLSKVAWFDETKGNFMLKARDGKQLKIKVQLYIGSVSNTKFTQTELDEVIVMLRSLCNLDFFKESCKQLDLDFEKEFEKIPKQDV